MHLGFISLLLLSEIFPQMRRMASSPASPAHRRIRIPGALRADPSGTMVRMSARWTAVVAAAAGQSYKDKVRGKTRPDSSRRPTGPSLISEEECKGPHPGLVLS